MASASSSSSASVVFGSSSWVSASSSSSESASESTSSESTSESTSSESTSSASSSSASSSVSSSSSSSSSSFSSASSASVSASASISASVSESEPTASSTPTSNYVDVDGHIAIALKLPKLQTSCAKAIDSLKRGEEFYDAKDWLSMITEYKKAIVFDPSLDTAVIWVVIGTAHFVLRQYSEAQNAASYSMKLQFTPNAVILQYRINVATCQFASALRDARLICVSNPTEPKRNFTRLVFALINHGRHAEAMKILSRETSNIDPVNFKLCLNSICRSAAVGRMYIDLTTGNFDHLLSMYALIDDILLAIQTQKTQLSQQMKNTNDSKSKDSTMVISTPTVPTNNTNNTNNTNVVGATSSPPAPEPSRAKLDEKPDKSVKSVKSVKSIQRSQRSHLSIYQLSVLQKRKATTPLGDKPMENQEGNTDTTMNTTTSTTTSIADEPHKQESEVIQRKPKRLKPINPSNNLTQSNTTSTNTSPTTQHLR